MINRSLFPVAFSPQWGRQMRFITGPRQSGKTTLSKMKLQQAGTENLYYLWDLRETRDRYKANELFFTQDKPPQKDEKAWVCFDEIHKISQWKNMLKGIFDGTEDFYQFIITGSAKLNLSKKAGDSLSGRYFVFHLLPLTLPEVANKPVIDINSFAQADVLILNALNSEGTPADAVHNHLTFGGFPEPFLKQNTAFLKKWSQDYLDRVITEDIGSLTRIVDRDKLYDLYRLLPEFIGNPLSEHSLAAHLQTNAVTVKNYLKRLEDFFLAFHITPYSKNIKRSLLKAAKWYLFDWTRLEEPSRRFENYVAVSLLTKLSLWQDLTGDVYQLQYIRDKEKKETDFLITKNNNPWMLIEAKLSDASIASHHIIHSQSLKDVPFVQVCLQDGVTMQQKKNIFRISASKFLA
jgi:predicted AAA+ superfamily ATPase